MLNSRMRVLRSSIVLLAGLTLLACGGCAFFEKGQSKKSREETGPSTATAASASSGHAYALLFDLLGDESDVSKLRIIKHERAALKDLTKEISRVSGAAHKQLEKFQKADRSLNLKDLGLPGDEEETRKAISKTKTKALLTEKGKDFEIQLLLSQHEAMVYGQHLAQIAGRGEMNAQRSQFLSQLAADLDRLQQKILEILSSNYNWVETK